MPSKRSEHELKRLVEQAIAEECNLPRPGLWFCADRVVATGQPIEHVKVWGLLHFTKEGSPFGCGEPCCALGTFLPDFPERLSKRLQHAMNIRHRIDVEFVDGINPIYHEGVRFRWEEEETDEWENV